MPGPSKVNQTENIPRAAPTLTQLFFHVNPSTGQGFAAEIQELGLLFVGSAPVTTFVNEAAMLANTTLPRATLRILTILIFSIYTRVRIMQI